MDFEIIFDPGSFGFYLSFDADFSVFVLFHRCHYYLFPLIDVVYAFHADSQPECAVVQWIAVWNLKS